MTLLNIKNGNIHGTVVQNPYVFGYESVRILDHCIKNNGKLPSDMPKNITIEQKENGPQYFVAPRVIKKTNDGGLFDMDVDSFSADLKQKKS
jgi:ABC-type sugar transport system substrate-binding protein